MSMILSIHVLVSILLIVIILLQQSKGAGLSSVFGGGGGQSLFGGRGAAPFLIKTTAVLAALFMLITFSLSLMTARRKPEKTAIEREIESGILPLEEVFPSSEEAEEPPPSPEEGE